MYRAVLRRSHLWRALDLAVPSNRLAVLALAVVTVVAGLLVAELSEAGIGAALLTGLRYGVGAFLAWALGRELDPDRIATARAALLVFLVLAWLGPPDLGALVALLLATRIVLRSTGRAPTTLDLGVVVLVAGVAATSAAGFVAALGLAWALHVDRRLPDPAPDRPAEVAAAAAGAVAVAVTIVAGSFLDTWELPRWYGFVVIVAVAAAAATLRTTEVRSRADRGGEPLHLQRLVHARRLALVVAAAALCWAGASALSALGPALAAVIAAGLIAVEVGSRLRSLLARTGIGTD